MTIREFYQAVIEANINDELTTKATELTAALDARNEKRKGTETKEKKETAERRAAVLAFLKEQTEPVTRDTIAGVLEMEPAKVSGACKGLVDAGLVTKSEVKVEKARKVAYSAVK
jgi:DNA-binding MarR family transcriptional regulator